ncbi:MAG: Lrp/AsnC family transcriptional regulator [Magnetococcales bacterium]|nr:Lrp/AsnC family transcriptional regulator [Magnetococcales bacterium]
MGYHKQITPLTEDVLSASLSLTVADLALLNAYQKNFPLVSRPYAEIAAGLQLTEEQVIQRLTHLRKVGVVSRIGAVLQTGKAGMSTLAAMEVPVRDLEKVAQIVNSYPEVNHNYEREHALNLWFVVTAADEERLMFVLSEIAEHAGTEVHILPMLDNFHIDLGFPLTQEQDERVDDAGPDFK